MIPKECKRLAEVDFPIAEVSKHSVREKSIRHGHPSTLHLWWARRPLAACRAMLLGLLLPDPADPFCPGAFKVQVRRILSRLYQGAADASDADLRRWLLKFIGDFANWDLSTDQGYLQAGRDLVKAAHGEEPPLVVDPFAGGGSIPLEALRLGCDAFASDLNPVACLILKVMLEDIPRYGPELAEELRRVGAEIKKQAEKELAEFYPKDSDGATPIAYLWARIVKCESPNCGAEIPLVRSFWLCKKANRKRALRYKVVCSGNESPAIEFEIFEPKTDKEVSNGTVTRAKATCPACHIVLPPERVRAQLSEQRGGADVLFDAKRNRVGGARLLAVVTLKPGEQGRHYRLPTERDYQAVWNAQKRLKAILDEWERSGRKGLCPVPDEPLPLMSGTFNVPIYGMSRWGDLFAARQKAAMLTLATLIERVGREETTGVLREVLSLSLGKVLRHCNVVSKWHRGSETVAGAFGIQALPMSWDFPEMFPLVDYAGGLSDALEDVNEAVSAVATAAGSVGQIEIADAAEHPLPDVTVSVWFTDPPYYFAIPYADLSDFFFVWLKRALPRHPGLVDRFDPGNPLTHKNRELCEMAHWDPDRYAHKNQKFFEEGMRAAFAEGRRVLREDGVGCVVFAHKTTEGWEALLSGMSQAGWTITGSWPVATERGARLRARESAALATSVHLVCRPRPENAPVGDWADVLRELPKRVGDWMERLQSEGIRGADLVFACIGPALEIFSRYSRVETADGREVKLAEYLEKVWEVVGRTALEQVLGTAEAMARNSAVGALEEDARLTALFLWTLQSTNGNAADIGAQEAEEGEISDEDDEEETTPHRKAKGYTLIFDVVRRFAQPLGINLPKWEGRIIETKKGIVRLLPVVERAKQLFGEDGAKVTADWIEHNSQKNLQLVLFPELEEQRAPRVRRRSRGKISVTPSAVEGNAKQEATTLDRVHAAMLLQAGGQTNALRALIKAEQERGPDFLRLANALSALYPKGSEEKRLLDAMLLAVSR
ncbi:DUF1156 domain-containing protein [Candidatus Desulforudis audaxviator]|uniref:DUF1156 domain-containing protein n=1 Tax=Desulforudis audaxviator (strain MP104C) TaxID=477974 RepID=B1I299_DESAP|nr:DUF1156 domain-containing protein [Candidatus Desulforudis audaxviator]ACA59052.1 protein of unknown function DUF1156 [Candidatus Desulforudis audaxviator MP104C]AZK59096.1 Adenine-specific DNA methylase containing a Zn-ribbon [Candidatus Desulforudis audaxviator]